jgi:hypothetical protein
MTVDRKVKVKKKRVLHLSTRTAISRGSFSNSYHYLPQHNRNSNDKSHTKNRQKRNAPSRRRLLGGKEKRLSFSSLILSCEDYWDPSWLLLRFEPVAWDDRRKECQVSNLTAAPFHRLDGCERIFREHIVDVAG